MTKKEIALKLIKDKYFILPIHYVKNDKTCSCNKPDCLSIGKHPMTAHGCLDASDTIEKVEFWWGREPNANIGIATEPSNLIVIDLDGQTAVTKFEELIGKNIKDADTKIVRTGSGFYHVYYKYNKPISSRTAITKEFDVKSKGGYVIAEGSNHVDGEYTLLKNISIAEIPTNILSFVKNSVVEGPEPDYIEELDPIILGNRNVRLVREAGKLLKLYDPFTAFRMLEAFNQLNVKPPLTPYELRGIIKSITNREGKRDKNVEIDPTHLITFSNFMDEYANIKEKWLIQDWLEEGSFCVIGAPPGSYKSWLGFGLCACIGGSGPFLGLYPAKETGPVLLIDQEDNPYDMASRFMSILNTSKTQNPKKFVNPNIMMYTGKDINIREARSLDFIENTIKKYGIIVCMIDPFYSILGKTDSYYNDTTEYVNALKELRDRYGCSFIFNHHTVKTKSDGRARDNFFGGALFQATLEQSWAVEVEEGNPTNPIINIERTTKYGPAPLKSRLELYWDKGFYAKELVNDIQIKKPTGINTGYKNITEENMRKVLLEGPAAGSTFDWIRGYYSEYVANNDIIHFLGDLIARGTIVERNNLFVASGKKTGVTDIQKEIELIKEQIMQVRDENNPKQLNELMTKLRILTHTLDKIPEPGRRRA